MEETVTEKRSSTAAACERLLNIIRILRGPGGCPWDCEQTPLSMRRDLMEEVFEAIDAISSGNIGHIKEELGDVCLNALMIAYMFEQTGKFTVADVFNELTEKLVRRHPHVFAESSGKVCMTEKVENASEVLKQWDKIKGTVEGRDAVNSILDEVPADFPPLLRAYKLQKKAAKKGFDWKTLEPVADKVREEFGEVCEAAGKVDNVKTGDPLFTAEACQEENKAQLHLEAEIGDLLFAVVNYARHLGVDPVIALSRANGKFYNRFTFVEQGMKRIGLPMDGDHLESMEHLWCSAKAAEQQ